jgi:hypothetical protein
MKSRFLLAILLFGGQLVTAEPILQTFQLWGTSSQADKFNLYLGWTNGFFQGRGERGIDLANCLEGMTYDQTIAMIDKHHKDHPEHWSRAIGIEILEIVTANGSPCEGKSPLIH